jgi:ribosomal protein S18 acetylase RimI-like enzyme
MLQLIGVIADKTPIGRLRVGLTHPRGVHGCAFIYDIEVDQAYRGMGYGRALLLQPNRPPDHTGLNKSS